MFLPITTKRRHRKPNVGAMPNYSHPLMQGARYLFPFNEGGGGYTGSSLRNLALPQTATTLPTDGTIGSTTNVTWTPRGDGGLAYANSTTSYVDCGANDDTTGEITWFAWIFPTSLPTLSTLFGQNTSGGGESIDSLYLRSTGRLAWYINHSIGETEILNGTASSIATNQLYRLAGRRKGVAFSWDYDQWINEKLDDSATGSTFNPTTEVADGNFRLGFAGSYTGAPFIGDFRFFYLTTRALKDHDVLSLSENPWQLWGSSPKRRLLVRSGGSSTTVTPTTATLTLTTFAPTVLAPRLCTPTTAALTTTKFAPVINWGFIPSTKALTLTTFAPTVAAPRLCTPTTKALTLTTFAPIVAAPRLCTPTTAALTLTAFAPTVSTPRLCTPTTKSLTLTTFAPTVSAPRLCTPTTAALTLTTFAPTISGAQVVTPTTRALVLTTFAPTVSAPRLCTPTTKALTLTTFAPTVSAPRLCTPTTVALTLTTFAPTVSTPRLCTPTTKSLTLTTFAPSVSLPILITPETLTLIMSPFVPTVTVSGGATVAERDVRYGVSYSTVSPPATRDVRFGVTY